MVHIKEPLLLIRKSSPCGGSGFSLSLSEWSFTICSTPYNRTQNVLSASLNKIFPSFFCIPWTTLPFVYKSPKLLISSATLRKYCYTNVRFNVSWFWILGQYDKMKSPMEWGLIPNKLVAMTTVGLIFFLITLLCEYRFFIKPRYCVCVWFHLFSCMYPMKVQAYCAGHTKLSVICLLLMIEEGIVALYLPTETVKIWSRFGLVQIFKPRLLYFFSAYLHFDLLCYWGQAQLISIFGFIYFISYLTWPVHDLYLTWSSVSIKRDRSDARSSHEHTINLCTALKM